MYFDVILDKDFKPVFNGTREETIETIKVLKQTYNLDSYTVVPGETLEQLTVDDYVIRYAEAPK